MNIKKVQVQLNEWIRKSVCYPRFYFELDNKYFFISPSNALSIALDKEDCNFSLDKKNFIKHNSMEKELARYNKELVKLEKTDNYELGLEVELVEFKNGDNSVWLEKEVIAEYLNCTYKQATAGMLKEVYVYRENELVAIVIPMVYYK